MPGPKSQPNKAHKHASAQLNRKQARRLTKRLNGFPGTTVATQPGYTYTKPGSQNRV